MQALMYEAPWRMPLTEVPIPEAGPGEVLVRVRAAGICGSDVHGYTGSTGRRSPGIVMGHEFCGEVAALGPGVDDLELGARVVVQPIVACGHCPLCREGQPNLCLNRRGIGWSVDGGYAQYARAPRANVLPLPPGVDFTLGALTEPVAVALRAANLTPLPALETVAVVGAGPIGLLCVLALRLRGAGRVIVSDLSERRLALARELGADLTVNAREADPVEAVRAETGGLGAAAVLEAVGASASVQQSVRMARRGGHVTWVGNAAPTVELPMQEIVTGELTVRGTYAFVEEFPRALEALASGRIDPRPLIERVAPLAEGPELIRALADGSLDAVKVVLTP